MESIQTVAIQIGVLFAVLLVIMGLLEYQERRHRAARVAAEVDPVLLERSRRLGLEIAATILAGFVEHRPPTQAEDQHYARRAVELSTALVLAHASTARELEDAKAEIKKWRNRARPGSSDYNMARAVGILP
jgi:hypothetical protein